MSRHIFKLNENKITPFTLAVGRVAVIVEISLVTLKELNFARTKFRGNLISRELKFANGIDSRNLISAKFNYNSKSCKMGARNVRKLSFCSQFAKFN